MSEPSVTYFTLENTTHVTEGSRNGRNRLLAVPLFQQHIHKFRSFSSSYRRVESACMSDTNVNASDREETDRPKPKLDREGKMKALQEKLANRKQRFYALSEEIFDVNQDCLSKNDELKTLKSEYSKHNKLYIRALTELALKEADLQYKKEHAVQKSTVVTDFALESNQDVERLRDDLKGALQKYQESRGQAKSLQAEFSKLADTSRVESLNFLAFCKYSQNVQLNEMNKLTLSAELPSRKEVNVCTTEFTRCAEQSRQELASYYKQKIHEFQREERLQMGKCKTQFEISQRNKDGQVGFGGNNHSNSPFGEVNMNGGQDAAALDHHLHVNSLENRYAQRLLADAQVQLGMTGQNGHGGNGLSGDGSFTFGATKESAKHAMDLTGAGAGRISPTTNAVFAPTLLFQPAPPPKGAKKNVSGSQKTKPNASYLAPTANTVHNSVGKYAPKEEEPSKLLSASLGAQKSKFRAQLSALYRSKKKAASALHEMHAAKHKGVFDATAFRSPATAVEDSALLHNTLLDAPHTDAGSNNMVLLDNGKFVDQGEQLGEMIAKLCAAEGKFRQLNAIKEGLDVQLVKQAHFLLLVARDLQSDIATKSRSSGHHASSLPPVTVTSSSGSCSNGVQTVSEHELTRAFARPDPSAHRSVGSLTAGGAISNKFRYRIDPSCVTAAPFVPLCEIQEDYEESEDKIRRIIAEAAAVLKVL